MTLIVQEIRDALVRAGPSEDEANAAETAATRDDLRAAIAELKPELIRAMPVQRA